MSLTVSLTVIVPTLNDELHLARCLRSVVGRAERVCVVDAGSTDTTEQVTGWFAKEGVEFHRVPWSSLAGVRNQALAVVRPATPWVLYLEPTEIVTPELAYSIKTAVRRQNPALGGYALQRLTVWYGREIRHGGAYPERCLRLLRTGAGGFVDRGLEPVAVVDGEVELLSGELRHEDLRDLAFRLARANQAGSLCAVEDAATRAGEGPLEAELVTRDTDKRRRWLHAHLGLAVPGTCLLRFVWAAVFRLGFRDGLVGLRYHFYRALLAGLDELKAWELARYKDGSRPGAIRVRPQEGPRKGRSAGGRRAA